VAAGHRHRIAPFMSILQDFEAWERFDNIKLVYSVREAKELAYVEEIAGLEQRDYLAEFAGKLQFIPVVTRETHPGALNARITTLIENGELERAAGLELSTEHSRVMLCGNPEMIDETRKVLKARDLQLSLSKRPGQVGGELLVAARQAALRGRQRVLAHTACSQLAVLFLILRLEQVADLGQQRLFGARYRRCVGATASSRLRRLIAFTPMKMAKGDDHEVDHGLDELAVGQHHGRYVTLGSLEGNGQVTEVHATDQQADGGMITSPTKDETILPKAAPMMIPTAMSTTLPLTAKALNSLSMPMFDSL
jgi:hypothetical protein